MGVLNYLTRAEVRALDYQGRAQVGLDLDIRLAVYVPAPGADSYREMIAAGSAIVGEPEPNEQGHVLIYYEGEVHGGGAAYTDMLRQAAGRACAGYPTSAKMFAAPSGLVRVGEYRVASDVLAVTDQAALDGWLSQPG